MSPLQAEQINNLQNSADDIQEVRYKICTLFLIVISLIAIPGLAASLYRSTEIGWLPVMNFHILIAITLWIITIFRKKLPYEIQAGFLLTLFFIIGISGIYQFGLVAGGITYLVVTTPLALILFGRKTGIIIFLLAFIFVFVISFFVVSGNLKYNFDVTMYVVSASSWVNAIISWAIASITLAISIHVYNKHLIKTLTISLRHQREAVIASHAKSQFLSSMSHELRTPLNSILGFSQLIEMYSNDEKAKKHSAEIISAGNYLLHLINEVLDLSKIESGAVELSITSVSFNTIYHDALNLIKPIIDKNDIRITDNIDPLNDIKINVDETRFKQILLNIFSNAVKYNSEKGEIIINSLINNKTFCLSITDTGQGLTKEQQKTIFLPFDRAGKENSNIEGVGLGLAISKKLIEQMNGSISVESKPGEGSSFIICVPIS